MLRMNIPLPGPFSYSVPVAPAASGCLFWLLVGPLLIWWWIIVGIVWIIGATIWSLAKMVELTVVGLSKLIGSKV
jgi:hypothetical protein